MQGCDSRTQSEVPSRKIPLVIRKIKVSLLLLAVVVHLGTISPKMLVTDGERLLKDESIIRKKRWTLQARRRMFFLESKWTLIVQRDEGNTIHIGKAGSNQA